MNKFLILLLALSMTACNSSDGDEAPSVETPVVDTTGSAFSTVSGALGSIADLLGPATLAGTENDNCTETGSPKSGGIAMVDTDTGYMGGVGYCQATFNSVSPDTVRGAMGIGSGMICEAGLAGLFTDLAVGESATATKTITINTDCWGTSNDVAALIADMGTDTLSNVAFTVEEVSGTTGYDYKVTLGVPDFGATLEFYLLNTGGVIAGLNTSDGWAFKLDTNTGTLLFESIDTSNDRRNRMMIEGTLNADNEYTAITSIKGFQEQDGSLYTYSGLLTGLFGDFYNGDSVADVNDRLGECFAPGGSEDCTGLVALTGNDTNSLRTNAAADFAALVATTDPIDFSDVDPTDTDTTD